MKVRLLVRTLLVATMLGSGGYVLLYLYRWEWNRALISGLFFLAAEGALLADGLAARLRRIEGELGELRRLRTTDPVEVERATAQASAQLAATRPAPADRFEWLRDSVTRSNVFVPFLMGAGVLLSALAWAVERVARLTAGPAMERRLAHRLAPLLYVPPEGGLVPVPVDPSPVPRRLRPGSSVDPGR